MAPSACGSVVQRTAERKQAVGIDAASISRCCGSESASAADLVRQGRPVQRRLGDRSASTAVSPRLRSRHVAFRYEEPNTALLQTTNTVYPGNGGGAALNPLGQLIGIIQGELGPEEVARVLAEERRPAGMSFIEPAEVVRRVYESLHRDGHMAHGFLGATTSAASVASESTPGADVPIGAHVESVVRGGPAALAGLRAGDLIVGFEGERVEYPAQLARWVATSPPGTAVHLVWVRSDLQQSGSVVLTASPDAAPRWGKISAPLAAENRPDGSRIADLQRQIERLSRELNQLKAQHPPERR
jgi:S1-C subfamily serine protease